VYGISSTARASCSTHPWLPKADQFAPDEFAGTIDVGIAGVKGVYTGKLKLEEVRAPEHYKMMVDGKGK
jgi:hypothetical protein